MMRNELFNLTGKVALITGGAGVQGRMYAQTLAEFGARVILADLDVAAARQVSTELAASGFDVCAVAVDITSSEQVQALAVRVTHDFGTLDVLVNNAGIVSPGRLTEDMPVQEWLHVLNINLTGAFLMIRAFLPLLKAGKGGSIINNGSMLGLVGLYPKFAMVNAPYAAAKAGLFGLTRQVAAEYAPDNVRCNAIAPGWHGGSGVQKSLNMEAEKFRRFEEVVMAGTPMGRRGRMEELRGVMVWLASDASSYVTGQVITLDGGWTAV